MQKALKPEFYQVNIDKKYIKINYDLNQDIKIEQSLLEISCEAYSDSITFAYIYLSMTHLQGLTHNGSVKEKF